MKLCVVYGQYATARLTANLAVRVGRPGWEGERGKGLQYPNKPQKAHTELLGVAKPWEVRKPTSSKDVGHTNQRILEEPTNYHYCG